MDADVLIQASRGLYQFERVPQFWMFLSDHIEKGNIRSVKMVYDELTQAGDELSQWVKTRQAGLCMFADKSVSENYGRICTHVETRFQNNGRRSAIFQEFARSADGWIMAHALANGDTVVTQESERSKNAKVKIKPTCDQMGIQCINTTGLIEALDFRISDYTST